MVMSLALPVVVVPRTRFLSRLLMSGASRGVPRVAPFLGRAPLPLAVELLPRVMSGSPFVMVRVVVCRRVPANVRGMLFYLLGKLLVALLRVPHRMSPVPPGARLFVPP